MKKEIQISGIYKLDNKAGPFTEIIRIEESKNSIYYSWSLRDNEEKFLGGKSRPLSFHQIPVKQDRFEFSESIYFGKYKKIQNR